MSIKYAYLRNGAPLIRWGTMAPHQSRAADTVSLGSLGGTTLDTPTLILPRPGAPEPLPLNGCSCSGTCGCGPGTGLSGIADSIPGGYVTLGVAAFLAWKFFKKR